MSHRDISVATGPRREYRGQWYRAVWRWHFYTGVLVIPFLFMLAMSGF